MAAVVTLTNVTMNQNGSVAITYIDGTGQIFDTFENLQMYISSVDTGDTGAENAKRMLLGWWLVRSPDGSNQNVVEGKTLTFDLSAANAVRVQ